MVNSSYGRDHEFHGQLWAWFTTAIFLFPFSAWCPEFPPANWQILCACRWPIQLQERAPKAHLPAPTVSEDEDSAERIIPDRQDGARLPVAQATFECFQRRRSCAKHVSTLRGRWKVDSGMHMLSYQLSCNICSAILHWVPELPDCRCMISWSRIYDIVYDIIGLWYHKFLIS
jgi:hypothetical protein